MCDSPGQLHAWAPPHMTVRLSTGSERCPGHVPHIRVVSVGFETPSATPVLLGHGMPRFMPGASMPGLKSFTELPWLSRASACLCAAPPAGACQYRCQAVAQQGHEQQSRACARRLLLPPRAPTSCVDKMILVKYTPTKIDVDGILHLKIHIFLYFLFRNFTDHWD